MHGVLEECKRHAANLQGEKRVGDALPAGNQLATREHGLLWGLLPQAPARTDAAGESHNALNLRSDGQVGRQRCAKWSYVRHETRKTDFVMHFESNGHLRLRLERAKARFKTTSTGFGESFDGLRIS